MMLVQKQPTLQFSQPHPAQFSHRRHPSAPPAVIVQPTRTPGLLSITKPMQKSSPQRQLPSNQRSSQQKQSPRPRQAQPVQHGLLNAAEITDKKNAVRPPKAAQKHTKGQSDSAKQTPVRHGKHPRQPSPSILPIEPSQVEAVTNNTSSDPFIDSFASTTFKPTSVLARPSGKLANRRLPHQSVVPTASVVATPTKAIPVPVVPRRNTQVLSRSVPDIVHSWDHICDDSNDEDSTGPKTPPRSHFGSNGPRTAPFSARAPGAFPFYETPSLPKRKNRNHKRTPSDYIFAMSSDDEAASAPEDLRALLNFVRSGSPASLTSTPPPPQRMVDPDYLRSLSPASREKFFELEAQKEVAGYFASSSFQNSPSPDDLPEPTF